MSMNDDIKNILVSEEALKAKVAELGAQISRDYEGFQVPDEFVVGYGLDYDEKYRNLPYVGVLKPEIYA